MLELIVQSKSEIRKIVKIRLTYNFNFIRVCFNGLYCKTNIIYPLPSKYGRHGKCENDDPGVDLRKSVENKKSSSNKAKKKNYRFTRATVKSWFVFMPSH